MERVKKYILFFIAYSTTLCVSAQYRESALDRLVWDDEMLNIMLDTRFDLNAAIPDGELDDVSFRGQTLRVWFSGEIVPGVRYRVRQRFNKTQNPSERDNLAGATDHAWIAFDVSKNWTITAGKQAVQLGTFEYDYNGADVYLGTMVANDFDDYQVGVEAAWKFSGQTLHFQVFNVDSEQFSAPDYRKKAMGGAVMWQGSLFNEILKTRWGYSAFQHTKTKFYHWLTAGIQLNAGGFKTELDYYLGDRTMDYSATVGPEAADPRFVRDRSASLNIEHTFGKWRPFVKAVWSERYDKTHASEVYETAGIQAVAEYYPFHREQLKDLRFHAAWMYSRTGFRGPFAGLEAKNSHTILVGMRWLFKVK